MKTPVLIIAIIANILLWQEALAQFLEPNCGLNEVTTNGSTAGPAVIPWLAFIYKTINQNETELVCGGSLIHKEFVLTATHCIHDDDILTVRLGANNSLVGSPTSKDYAVKKAFKNEYFSRWIYFDDIAILRLGEEVQFNDFIRPICIFTDSTKVPDIKTFQTAIWEKTQNDKISGELKILHVNEYHRSQCEETFWKNMTENQICAGPRTGVTCVRVSGAPLIQVININGTLRYAQFGIASFGASDCRGLEVYTRVSSYIEWILDVLGSDTLEKQS
ncbi:melanization protease 1-like isoform X3 [Drosophila eugracilis]|uniref:melanization protease 1-like isoform X3 n=1 Tax=Drosophila eugracilis TaxID=29029 RepID=UPI0007E83635|nr:melanization protease 1-like isoform X3 [Drosophila eugracilis]